MFQSYDHLHMTETCSGYWNKILNNYSNSVALHGNPEPEPKYDELNNISRGSEHVVFGS
jgi:hypothetical protein